MADTLIWISGATQGIGLGLARQVPWKDAKIINISRRRPRSRGRRKLPPIT